jgi:hypothetical protein
MLHKRRRTPREPSMSPTYHAFVRPLSHGQLMLTRCEHSPFRRDGSCEPADPANTVTDRLNNLLTHGGDGFVLSLCPSTQYLITAPLAFASPNQEISTQGYPTDNSRATLVVNGPVENGQGHTTAVDGTCATCSGIKIRNIQVRQPRMMRFVHEVPKPVL